MTEDRKSLPIPTPWSRPFWEACKRHELLIQQCGDCGAKIFYPKLFCPECLSSNLGWIQASGKGKVYTFTTVYGYQPGEFTQDVPYVVAVIRLEEGVQMMANIVGCRPEELKCDMDVQVIFEDVTEDISLPRFKPVVKKPKT